MHPTDHHLARVHGVQDLTVRDAVTQVLDLVWKGGKRGRKARGEVGGEERGNRMLEEQGGEMEEERWRKRREE